MTRLVRPELEDHPRWQVLTLVAVPLVTLEPSELIGWVIGAVVLRGAVWFVMRELPPRPRRRADDR